MDANTIKVKVTAEDTTTRYLRPWWSDAAAGRRPDPGEQRGSGRYYVYWRHYRSCAGVHLPGTSEMIAVHASTFDQAADGHEGDAASSSSAWARLTAAANRLRHGHVAARPLQAAPPERLSSADPGTTALTVQARPTRWSIGDVDDNGDLADRGSGPHDQAPTTGDTGGATGWSIADVHDSRDNLNQWYIVGTALRITIKGTLNNAPTVATEIPDQTAMSGTAFSYQFPPATFTDADSDTLTYTATLADDRSARVAEFQRRHAHLLGHANGRGDGLGEGDGERRPWRLGQRHLRHRRRPAAGHRRDPGEQRESGRRYRLEY